MVISTSRKNTNTGSYTYYKSYIPWDLRTAWIKSFASHTSCKCRPYKLYSETSYVRKLAPWNSFPKAIVKSIINQTLNQPNEDSTSSYQFKAVTIHFRKSSYSSKGVS